MTYLILTCIILVIAVLTNSFSAWLQRKYKVYDHLGPTAWNTHQFVIAPAWLVFIIMSTQIDTFISWPLPFELPGLGWLLTIIAVLIFAAAIQVLGVQSLTNGNLFGYGPKHNVHHGIFRYLNHPIYDSFTLGYIAAGFISNNGAYFLLAAVLHLLLNHIQANLENID